jgi:dCMP deaminase
MTWDQYFMNLCDAIASKSPCLSRKIGCILVRDNVILSTGYNGPPRKAPHCDSLERLHQISDIIDDNETYDSFLSSDPRPKICPRRILNYPSGQGLHLCIAAHAEENCISTAARVGVSVKDSTLYINTGVPCSRCLGHLVNAGVTEIVALEPKLLYDYNSGIIIKSSWMKIRGPR